MRKKITLSPIKNVDDTKYSLTPKEKLRCWCWGHSKELIEMASEVDFEMFDKLWPDVANIFGLDSARNCATCEKDCDTCAYRDSGLDSPCWECSEGESQYIKLPN